MQQLDDQEDSEEEDEEEYKHPHSSQDDLKQEIKADPEVRVSGGSYHSDRSESQGKQQYEL